MEEGLRKGKGVILALPHLGGWEWAGFWIAAAKKLPITVVVEPIEPPQLFEWFEQFEDVENHVKVATMDDLEENEFNLNIPRYVEKVIEDDLPTVEEAMADLKEAWEKAQAAEARFKQLLQKFTA